MMEGEESTDIGLDCESGVEDIGNAGVTKGDAAEDAADLFRPGFGRTGIVLLLSCHLGSERASSIIERCSSTELLIEEESDITTRRWLNFIASRRRFLRTSPVDVGFCGFALDLCSIEHSVYLVYTNIATRILFSLSSVLRRWRLFILPQNRLRAAAVSMCNYNSVIYVGIHSFYFVTVLQYA